MNQKGNSVPKSIRYELIDKYGMRRGIFDSAAKAAEAAERIWPEQSQDHDRTGRGWDVQVVGAK
jgi:tetrahydromethanopterin S-methyltransferase subunit H